MNTNLSGRVRNTPLPLANALLPLYEAVINSIHAIDDHGLSTNEGQIQIEILRKPREAELDFGDGKKKRGPDSLEEIIGFRITDNGVGFTDDNMKSFETLDSEHKAARGGRGIGRLLWLKAFKRVTVESVFADAGGLLKKRTFVFDSKAGVRDERLEDSPSSPRKTEIKLLEFATSYREHSRKSVRAISDSILEHCLWYFIRAGSAPLMTVSDSDETISLQDSFEDHMHSSAVRESINVKHEPFDLIHVKLRSNLLSAHSVALCADNRLVTEEKLPGRIPGLHGKISDSQGEFIYSCYVCSPYLDRFSRPERTSFEIPETIEGIFKDTEISLHDIREAVIERSREQLKDHIAANMKRAKERVNAFVAHKAPRYRPILSRIPESELNIDPEISDKDLELTLHKHLAEIEGQLLSEGHDLMMPKAEENPADYSSRLADYLRKAEDIKKSDLVSYVSHRKVILDLLARAIERGPDGRYSREDLIHSLIMPMRTDSNEVLLDNCNLWVVDERLAFHDYLSSDKPLSTLPITSCEATKEPDICALNVFDNPMLVSEGKNVPLASIVVVEFKKPMRNDAAEGVKKDPVEQAVDYLSRIRAGGVTTAAGRPIPGGDNVPGFCYILCDLTERIRIRCERHHDFRRTSDGLGYFGFKANSNAYVEVISFDRLVNAAKERNRAFFDKLGLPTN